MTEDTKNDEDQWSGHDEGEWPGPPYIVYRNPQDDKIALAFQEAAKQLRAEGKPLDHPKKH